MTGARQLEDDANSRETTVADSLLKEMQESKVIQLSSLHRRGTVLFSEGQPARGVYLLRAGRAKVSISSSEGRIVILRIAQAGDLLGVNSALRNSPYDSTIETLEPSSTEFISRADFLELLDRSRTALFVVSEALSKELTDAVEHARSLLLARSAAEKLASLLLRWCDEHGEVRPEGIRLSVGVTQEEIGQMICVSRETVSRLLADLKRKHLVSLADNAIFVRSRKELDLLTNQKATAENSTLM
jgi:CRP/FNR family cyclic AMP-dependent transcriptional regulator